MRFNTLYRLSFYIMLFLAALVLNIDAARDYSLSPLYPIAVALAGGLALVTVDRNPAKGLPRDLANLLALGAVVPSIFECWFNPSLLVLAMGHWLVTLTLVKIFLPKTVEDDWFLFLLGLTQVVVGAFLPGERNGYMILLWALVALWTLGLFHLRRESLRPAVGGAPVAVVEPAPDPREPYPGLFDLAFLWSVARIALLTLALGGLIFLLMPRWENRAQQRGNVNSPSGYLTGFSDSVKLGQMGEILESDDIVMSIELTDEDDNRVPPPAEPYWRGVTLQDYEDGRWTRQRPEPRELSPDDLNPPMPLHVLRQRVKLEAAANETLFSLRPVVGAEGRDLLLNGRDGTLYRADLRPRKSFLTPYNRHPGNFDYTSISDAAATALQPGERFPSSDELQTSLLEVPTALRTVLQPIVDAQLKDIPAEDLKRRAEALMQYLRDGGQYTYSLSMRVQDPSIDPIADFVLNTRQGHCEYFASGLAMLLRTAGIPSRIVHGFKGGDWNTFGQVIVVREKHAHSWVEALVGMERTTGFRNRMIPRPVWIRLDATPYSEREEVVAEVGAGTGRRFRTLSDYLRYIWVFYVVGFDPSRQQRVIYEPIRTMIQEGRRGFVLMAANLRTFVRSLFHFPNFASLFSARGFVVSVGALLLLTGLYRLLRWLYGRLSRRWNPEGRQAADLAGAVACYRRLLQILQTLGLERPAAETPREFARRSALVIAARGGEAGALAEIPAQVVDAFYSIRFGDQMPDPDEFTRLDTNLDALESSLKSKH